MLRTKIKTEKFGISPWFLVTGYKHKWPKCGLQVGSKPKSIVSIFGRKP